MAPGTSSTRASRLQAAAPVDGVLVGRGDPGGDRATRSSSGRRSRCRRRERRSRCRCGKRSGSRTQPAWKRSSGARRRSSAARDELDALARRPRSRRTRASRPARHPRGRARDRQEPSRVGAVAARRRKNPRHRRGGRAVAALRRRRHVLGARRDGRRRRPGSWRRTRPSEAEAKLQPAVAAAVGDAAEAPWVERHLRTLVGLGGRGGDSRRPPNRGVRGVAAVPRGVGCAAAARARLRGHPLGGRRAARLRRPPRRWARASVLVLCTARPELLERRPGWSETSDNALNARSPRSPIRTRLSWSAACSRRSCSRPGRAALLARAGGNPLYAERVRPHARRPGLVAPEARRSDERRSPLPESVQAIIAARLDALPSEEKALLQDAAVVGRASGRARCVALGACRAGRSRSCCSRSSARGSCAASAAPPSPARRSTRSGTFSFATSRTGRSRAAGAPRSTGRGGVDRVAERRAGRGPCRDARAPLPERARVRPRRGPGDGVPGRARPESHFGRPATAPRA